MIAAAEGVTAGVTFDRLLKANQEPWNWLTFGGTYQSLRNSASESDHAGKRKEPGIEMGFSSALA